MKKQPDEVSLEDAYAVALAEIGKLQERVILGQAFIETLKRNAERKWVNFQPKEVDYGTQGGGDTEYDGGDDSPVGLSD